MSTPSVRGESVPEMENLARVQGEEGQGREDNVEMMAGVMLESLS